MNGFDENTAKAIVVAIIEDGAATAYMAASESVRVDMMAAYLKSHTAKIEKMQTMYMTNPEFRNEFITAVYELCK